MVMRSEIAAFIRAHKSELTSDWERGVLGEVAELARLERGALIDHLPEVLNGLAAALEGRHEEANASFALLADGHALQRLGFGFDLAVLNVEYRWLRRVLLRRLMTLPPTPALAEEQLRLHDSLDEAIHLSICRYTERRDYVRERFVSILGHDLRNPLGAVSMAAAKLLRSPNLDPQDRKPAEMVARAAGRMARVVSDVLDFARGHLGEGIPSSPVQCDLGELCEAATEELRSAHPQRRLVVETRGDLRGCFDRERVLQALGNLLGNAIAHGEDPIVVSAWEATDRGSLLTRVTNAGPAIPPGAIATLFDAFSNAGARTKDSLGLGLYIVSQIARAHGGRCEVASREGETAFTVHWPRVLLSEVPARP